MKGSKLQKNLISSLAVAFLSASLTQPVASATPPDGAVVEEFGVIQGTASDYDSLTKETLTESEGSNSSDLPFFAARRPYTIVSQWSDKQGWTVYLREQARVKIQNKHGLSIRAVQATTKYAPNIKNFGDRYEYRLPMDHISCKVWGPWRMCRKLETRNVMAIVGFNKIRDGKPYGVVTTYCEGVYGRCPQWIIDSPQIK